jgi:alpha-galactosidase
MDMLELGTWTMTELQEQTHFSFWAALKSPLIIGADLNNISDTSLAILKNKEIVALNQDDGGKAVSYLPGLSVEGKIQVWAGPLTSGRKQHVILALNYGSGDADITIPISDVPGLSDVSERHSLNVRDVWNRKDIGKLGDNITLSGVKPTQTKVIVISR